MSVEPGGPLERALDDAILRHPAAKGGIGVRIVELAPPIEVAGQVLPPVRLVECLKCGALFQVGSPHVLAHHRRHRRRSPMRRIRRVVFRADRWVRALLTRG